MIEDQLINYGVLGLWTLTLLVERYRSRQEFKDLVKNNTTALIRVHEVISKCERFK